MQSCSQSLASCWLRSDSSPIESGSVLTTVRLQSCSQEPGSILTEVRDFAETASGDLNKAAQGRGKLATRWFICISAAVVWSCKFRNKFCDDVHCCQLWLWPRLCACWLSRSDCVGRICCILFLQKCVTNYFDIICTENFCAAYNIVHNLFSAMLFLYVKFRVQKVGSCYYVRWIIWICWWLNFLLDYKHNISEVKISMRQSGWVCETTSLNFQTKFSMKAAVKNLCFHSAWLW